MTTLLDHLVQSVKAKANYQPLAETAPAAIIWPDKDREWEPLLPSLRQHLHILTLGPYTAPNRIGPATWIRCMVSRVLDDKVAATAIPVIYLPGIGTYALKDPYQRPSEIDPLVEVYYRSVLWVDQDGGDCKVREYICRQQDGLGIQVRDDSFTERAMLKVLPALANLTIEQLHEEEPWKAKDFEGLVTASITTLISMGESADLEFKSTARWDIVNGGRNVVMEQTILKSVAGFLNSPRGGTLLIGVEDNGNVCGIEQDYQTFSKPEDHNCDAYERWLLTLLLNAYGQQFAPFIHISFHPATTGTVCKIVADPARKPVVYKETKPGKQPEEMMYIRTGNATNALTLSAALEYYETRWETRWR